MPRICTHCGRRVDENELLLKGTIICVCGHLLNRNDTFKVPKHYFDKGNPETYMRKEKEKRRKANKVKRRQKQKTRRKG